jgi:phosphate transport system permease protein
VSTLEAGVQTQAGPPRGAAKAAPRVHRSFGDPAFRVITLLCGLAVAVAMFALAGVLIVNSWTAITELGLGFLTTVSWAPSSGSYGALAALAGTALTTLVAMVIAVPLALVIALLLTELVPPRAARVVGTGIEMLAAIPSIIFGMWGLFVLVPFMQERVAPAVTDSWLGGLPLIDPGPTFQGGGFSILTAGLVLALMVLPYITAFSRDVLLMVPRVTKEAGYGMGSTTWEVLRKISLRYALSGIVGATFIGLGRALGETMAVAYLVGGDFLTVPKSLFDPGTTVASLIALQFSEATTELDVSALTALGLVLFAITMVFQVLAHLWLRRSQRTTGGRA